MRAVEVAEVAVGTVASGTWVLRGRRGGAAGRAGAVATVDGHTPRHRPGRSKVNGVLTAELRRE